MNIFNKGLATLFQPFLRKTFNLLLGEFIDQNGINFEDLTLNGLKNLKLDVYKINQKYFLNSHLLMEKCHLNSIKIYFSMQKKIQIIIESVECGFYVNEDIAQKEQNNKDTHKKNFNKKQNEVEIQIENNKKILETIQNYQIEIIIKDIKINIKPTRTTLETDYFILYINDIKLQKNPQKNIENSKYNSSIIDINIEGVSFVMQKKKTLDQSMVNQQTQKQHYKIFQQEKPLKLVIEIQNKNQEFNITLNGKVEEFFMVFNYEVIGLIMIFYQKIMNFEQSKLILYEDWDSLDSLTQSHATYLADKFVNKFDQKFEQIFQSFDFKFAESFGYENSFGDAQNIQQNIKIFAKIIIKKTAFILYDGKEFEDIDLEIKPNIIDNNYLNIFPFENYQLVINQTEFIFKQNSQVVHIQDINISHLKRTQNTNQDNSYLKNLNNSSALLQSMIDVNYEVQNLLRIDFKKQDSINNIQQDEFNLQYEFNRARKNSLETNQISNQLKNSVGICIKLQNKTIFCLITHIDIDLLQCFHFISQFLKNINYQIDNLMQDSLIGNNLLKDFDSKIYFKEFFKLNHKEVINKLQTRFKEIQKKQNLIFDIPFNIIFCIRTFKILLNDSKSYQLLKFQNLQINLVDLKKLNQKCDKKFMSIENINLLEIIDLQNINISLSNLDFKKKECKITAIINALKTSINISEIQKLIQNFNIKNILGGKVSQEFTKQLELFGENQDDIVGIYETDENKIKINNLLNEIAQEIMPKVKMCSFFQGGLRNINIQIFDDQENVLQFINDYLFSCTDSQIFIQDLDYSEISERRYDKVELMNCKIESIDFTLNDEFQKVQITNTNLKCLDIWTNQTQEYLLEVNLDNLISKNSTEKIQTMINSLNIKIDSSQKRINILKKIIEYYANEINFDMFNNIPKSEQKIESQKKQIELKVNSIEFLLLEFLMNIKVNITNIKFENDKLYVPYTQITRQNLALKTEQNILEIFSIYNDLQQKQFKIKTINMQLDFQLIKTLSEFSTYLKENLQLFQEIYIKKIKNKFILEKQESEGSKDNFQSFLQQTNQNNDLFNDFELVAQFWDIYMSFKNIVTKKNMESQPIQYLKQFLESQDKNFIIENQIQIDEIKLCILDDVIESEYIISLKQLCLIQNKFLIGVLDQCEFSIKQHYNQDIIFKNSLDTYAAKFFINQNDELNLYLGLGTLNFEGKQKLWEILDKRLKIFLKDYYKQKEQKIEIQNNFEVIESDISQTIGEVFIDAFKIIIKLSQQEVTLNVEETNSLEIINEEKFIEDQKNLVCNQDLLVVLEQYYFSFGEYLRLFFQEKIQ